jgi:K+-transporting ATPase ATPase C chain
MKIGKDLRTALIAMVALTVVLGLAYPLAVTGIAQVVFPGRADGSPVKVDGKVVGSRLIGRPFVLDTGKKDADGNAVTTPDPTYFQPRPSATGYSPSATFFSNRGPNAKTALRFYRDQIAAFLALNRRYDPGLTPARIPIDAVTTSASGVDPHISEANARIQARRVAAVRGLPLAAVDRLVAAHTDGRFLGVIGEPGVNVLELDLALDKAAR